MMKLPQEVCEQASSVTLPQYDVYFEVTQLMKIVVISFAQTAGHACTKHSAQWFEAQLRAFNPHKHTHTHIRNARTRACTFTVNFTRSHTSQTTK
eukprot:4334061-Amphidinium_carterae.1